MGLTRRARRIRKGGAHPDAPPDEQELNRMAATLTSGELVLNEKNLDAYISILPALIEIQEKNSLDNFVEEMLVNKEYKGVLSLIITKETFEKIEKDAILFANSTYRSQTIKAKSKVSNILKNGPVVNAAVKQRAEIYKKEIKSQLEKILSDAGVPSNPEVVKELSGLLEHLKDLKRQAGGGYDATTIDGMINEYVRKHAQVDMKWRRVASRVFGIMLIASRGIGYTAILANGPVIAFALQSGAASAVKGAAAALILLGKIIGGLFAALFGFAGVAQGSQGSSAPPPTFSSAVSSVGLQYLQYRGLMTIFGLDRGASPAESDNALKELVKAYKLYDFVKTRAPSGMRIYNPFMKAHLPFAVLPTASVIKYALSFIFIDSPTLEPYGDEVSVIWRDSEFDRALEDYYKDDSKSKVSINMPGFKGNLFVGDGIFIKGTQIDVTKYVKPWETVIDANGLPWTLKRKLVKEKNGRNTLMYGPFALLISTEDQTVKNAIKSVRTSGNALKALRGTSSHIIPSRETISPRSVEHPAYDLTHFTGFRNAVYLAARYKLKLNGKPETVNPMHALRASNDALPRGWSKIVENGETYYQCDDVNVESTWYKPTESCT